MTEPVSPPTPATALPFPALGSSNFNQEAFNSGNALPGVMESISQQSQASYTNAVAAKEKAIAAGVSANTATTQADLAMGYRNTANNAAGTATAKALEAEASAVQASKLILGPKSAAPTVDNQGAVLLQGAAYYDTTLGKWRAWSGSAWVDPVSVTAGVTSLNGASGALTRTTLAAYGITDGVAVSGDQTIAGNKLFTGNVLLTGGGALGYSAGGTATQNTSKSAAVPLNKLSGVITTAADALAAGAYVNFTLNNSTIGANDQIVVQATGGAVGNEYQAWVSYFATGVCVICLRNNSAAARAEAVGIRFSVFKGASS